MSTKIMKGAGNVRVGIGPVGDFRAVEELQSFAATRSLASCRANLVAAIEQVEDQLMG
jgi:hypothetical protein